MKKLLNTLRKVLNGARDIALADVLFVIGLLSLGYGLYLLRIWLSFAVVGTLLLLVALGLGKGEQR